MPVAAYITSDRLPREVVPGIFWLGGCSNSAGWPGRESAPAIHEPLASYLVAGRNRTLLVDTGHFAHWYAIEPQLESVLGARTLDYIFPTHPEIPHSGNLGRLMQRYPDSVAVGDTRDYHVYFPEIAADRWRRMNDGDVIDLGGSRFYFLEPVWRDLTSTMWGYEATAQALFPSDGLGYLHTHAAEVCGLLGDELPESASPAEPTRFANGGAFHWMKYKDMEGSVDAFRRLMERYPVSVICSAHGAPVSSGVDTFVSAMLDAISSGGRGTSLHAQR